MTPVTFEIKKNVYDFLSFLILSAVVPVVIKLGQSELALTMKVQTNLPSRQLFLKLSFKILGGLLNKVFLQ